MTCKENSWITCTGAHVIQFSKVTLSGSLLKGALGPRAVPLSRISNPDFAYDYTC